MMGVDIDVGHAFALAQEPEDGNDGIVHITKTRSTISEGMVEPSGDVEGNIRLLLGDQLGALNAGSGSQERPFPKALKCGIISGSQTIREGIPYGGALAGPFQDIQIVPTVEKGEFFLRRLPSLNESRRGKGKQLIGLDEFIGQSEPNDLQWVGGSIIVIGVSIGINEGSPHVARVRGA